MEFTFETLYNKEALTVMAKTLRKTVRKKRSRRSHTYGIVVIILGLLLSLPLGNEAFVVDVKTILTWLVVLMLILTLIFEDKLNGYVAKKRMLPGLDKSVVVFKEEGYFSETSLGKSEFKYDTILSLAETKNYFVFLFSFLLLLSHW